MHQTARLTPKGREVLIRRLERGERPGDMACAMGVSVRTVYKWRARYRAAGLAGLRDRSSRPARRPARTSATIVAEVIRLCRKRRTMDRIAARTDLSWATVGRILARHGLNRWRDPDPAEPVVTYERAAPGERIHIDIKTLGKFARTGHRITGDPRQGGSRGIGRELVHVCVDDQSRQGFSQLLDSECKEDAVAFLRAAVAWYRAPGLRVARVMTDNGSCYRSKAFASACAALGPRHLRTRPYTPKTNGKAERVRRENDSLDRFLFALRQSSLRERVYGRAYQTSDQGKAERPHWLHHDNWHRPHAGINRKPPISRSGLDVNNLMRLHS